MALHDVPGPNSRGQVGEQRHSVGVWRDLMMEDSLARGLLAHLKDRFGPGTPGASGGDGQQAVIVRVALARIKPVQMGLLDPPLSSRLRKFWGPLTYGVQRMFPELEAACDAAEEAQVAAQAQADMFRAGVSELLHSYGPPLTAAVQTTALAPRSRAPSPGRAPTATSTKEASTEGPTVCVAGSLGAACCLDGHGEGGKCKYGAEYGQGKAQSWADLADRVMRSVKTSKGQTLERSSAGGGGGADSGARWWLNVVE
ncbi:hypothetical protein PLESTF_000617300 [Pleodorina starrii]|nr:hypothetical protein PLESTF_000617300 [Pleodorina starrii]